MTIEITHDMVNRFNGAYSCAGPVGHLDAIREGLAYVAPLIIAAASQWQDIKTAPKDGTPILTYWPTLYGIEKVSVRSWQKGSWQGGITEGWADCFMQIKPKDQPSLWAPIVLPVQP
jgi:hypothetical protein